LNRIGCREIEELRYYLIKIVDAKRLENIDESIVFLKQSFHNTPLGGYDWIKHPFSNNEQIIIRDMLKRYCDILIQLISLIKILIRYLI
jgi:hypothetical protein